jgi:hypothetical protein
MSCVSSYLRLVLVVDGFYLNLIMSHQFYLFLSTISAPAATYNI